MNWQDADTVWLIAVNVALGLVTLVPVLVVVGSVLIELLDRRSASHT
jgi:hypothetical protein